MNVRAFASVAVGDTIGPVTIPVSRAALVAYASASGDHNPIHQNEEFAKGVGLPNVIAHGMFTMGATGTVVSDWAGDAGRVVQFGTRFSAMVVVPEEGTDIQVTGVVKALDTDAETATVELTTTCDGTKVLGRCLAVVRLG